MSYIAIKEITDAAITSKEIRAFVDPRAVYYLENWKYVMADPTDHAVGFKRTAFLVPGFWLLYRKMCKENRSCANHFV